MNAGFQGGGHAGKNHDLSADEGKKSYGTLKTLMPIENI